MQKVAIYRLVLHENRSLTERQRAGITGHLEELRHLVRLAIALLAGILAALGLIGQAGWMVAMYAVWLTGGSLLTVLAAAMGAVHAAAGLSNHELTMGPDPEALVAQVDQWTEPSLLVALADAEARQFEAARRVNQLIANAMRRATRLLLLGTVLAAMAMALIVGGAIE